ncbi:MAG: ATPase/protein kinase family protein [Myxococcaceae bacterium]|nr:ATPase/protein kinase family protein [Myxococcaceae bacterium]
MESVLHTQRFEVVRRLGAGATGVVYEAYNRKSGERVALKALQNLDASSLYRFKREFRALSGVFHPNLVTLNELFHEGGRWYLSMELVSGLSFVEYVRGTRSEPDLSRLRPALAQLVQALQALHEAGRLHRDIKPSNVLVTDQGRAVVLDFGFVREIGGDTVAESAEILGTPAYMAPEQADVGGSHPASDWYSVGVMLFEALTGRLPFTGSNTSILIAKLDHTAPLASKFWPRVPPDLEQLCAELLARDPAARPLGRALLERLPVEGAAGAQAEPAFASSRPSHEPFVGRAPLLERLAAALESTRRDNAPRVVTIAGASAVGKSALLERFADSVDGADAWVFLGRCHERENVPYKALDGIIDAIVRRMSELSEVELALLLPRYLGALSLQFPMLLRIPAIARQAARYLRPADPHELRRHAAGALQELLARIADHRPLVLLIDDLQWGDVDSVHLLRDALNPEDMPGILLVVAQRNDGRGSSLALQAFAEAMQPLRRRGRFEALRLEPLEADEAEQLARLLLAPLADDLELLQHVVRESGRVPLFIHELARHVLGGGRPDVTLGELVRQSIARLSAPARRLIELVAVASAPLPVAVARDLLDVESLEQTVLRELLNERLVRQAFHPIETLDARHDQIRGIVRSTLTAEQLASHHLSLARELARSGADPELLAHHFLSAGDPAHAARYVARAAEAAARALAFTTAARCYELALSWGVFHQQEKRELMVARAEALANAGRGGEAGETYLRAADLAAPEDRPMLRSRAVDQLLRAGQLEAGLALGDAVLQELGLSVAQTGRSALIALLGRRAWLWVRGYEFEPRAPSQVEPLALARVEAARAMSLALGHMDPFAAANMQARHLMLALQSGDAFSVARALGYEAVYLGIEGAAQSGKAMLMLERERELSPAPSHPYLLAFGHYAKGVVDWGRGHWSDALIALDHAESGYRNDCTGAAWEILASQLFSLGCLSFLGRYDELRRRIARIADEARARDDRLTLQWIFAWQAVADILRGDLPAAKQGIASARARLPEQHYTLPHLFVLLASTYASLYAGDGRAALARIDQEWPAIKQSQLLRLQVYRVELLRLRALAALCAAKHSPAGRRSLHAQAERDLARMEGEHVDWADAIALAHRGELRLQQADRDAALGCWELAEERLRAVDMDGYAAATRRRMGVLKSGSEGESLIRSADAWFGQHGVVEPERVSWLLLGGYER